VVGICSFLLLFNILWIYFLDGATKRLLIISQNIYLTGKLKNAR